MPIFAQALTCRKGYQQIAQVAVSRAPTEEYANSDGLSAILINFPPAEGYTAHDCVSKQVSVNWILKEAADLFGIDISKLVGKDSQ